jgi:hypothetical protein
MTAIPKAIILNIGVIICVLPEKHNGNLFL